MLSVIPCASCVPVNTTSVCILCSADAGRCCSELQLLLLSLCKLAAHGTALCLLQCVHRVALRNTDTSCGIRNKTAFAKMMWKVLCLTVAAEAARSAGDNPPPYQAVNIHMEEPTAAGAGSFSYLQAADPAAAASQVAATAADAGVVSEIRALGAQVDAGGQTAEHALVRLNAWLPMVLLALRCKCLVLWAVRSRPCRRRARRITCEASQAR